MQRRNQLLFLQQS